MSGIRLDDAQRLDWLRLIRSEGIGPRTFRALLRQHGSARAALDALPGLARKAGRYAIRIASAAEAERETEAAGRLGIRFVALGEAEYPAALRAIDTAPPLIAVRGAVAALAGPTVAIVGSRNASAAGGAFAERLAAELGGCGLVVASGLARGIDTRAHRGALPTGTVAVLAGGHARVYPSENRPLLDRIVAEGGAAVSEMPLSAEPRARDFPRRNRIVSGLSLGVVVIEAARRSGSLITARFALEQGREVFAVPGSPLDARAEGTNELIRNGATLCARAEHVEAVLRPLLGVHRDPPGWSEPEAAAPRVDDGLWEELLDGTAPAAAGPDEGQSRPIDGGPATPETRILALLGPVPVTIDDLARGADMPVARVRTALVELEVAGRLGREPNGAVSLLR